MSTLKAMISARLHGASYQNAVAIAKAQALNLGIHVATKQERLVTASKYAPHAGKKEVEKAKKRLALVAAKSNP